MLKWTELVIFVVYYTIPFGSACFSTFWASICNVWNYFIWLRITDEGSVPEIRIWSMLLIKSDLKWCIHLVEVSFYISTSWWVSLPVDQWVPEGICSQTLRSTSFDSLCVESITISVLKLTEIIIFWVYYTIPFGFSLFWHFLGINFQFLKLHCLAKDHWRGFSTRNTHMVHVVY